MAHDIENLNPEITQFLTDRHLASLTLIREDGTPHVAPVGFSWDAETGLARVITWNGSFKARLLERVGTTRAALCQIDGGRWLTLEGDAVVSSEPHRCAEGVRRYSERYRPPKDRGDDRRVIEIAVDRVMGRA